MHHFHVAPGVLSIDVDGNDYWFLEALLPWEPQLVIVEYNASLGLRPLSVSTIARLSATPSTRPGGITAPPSRRCMRFAPGPATVSWRYRTAASICFLCVTRRHRLNPARRIGRTGYEWLVQHDGLAAVADDLRSSVRHGRLDLSAARLDAARSAPSSPSRTAGLAGRPLKVITR